MRCNAVPWLLRTAIVGRREESMPPTCMQVRNNAPLPYVHGSGGKG